MPYRPEEKGSAGADKIIYIVASAVKLHGAGKKQDDESNEYRTIDVLVNPTEIEASDHDGTGFTRERVRV